MRNEHPLRRRLNDEVHARPHKPVTAPARVIRLAFLCGEAGAGAERAHLKALCTSLGAALPDDGSRDHVRISYGNNRLGWERHTEFVTLTFYIVDAPSELLDTPAMDLLPGALWDNPPGDLLVALDLAVQSVPDLAAERCREALLHRFPGDSYVASRPERASAVAAADFRIDGDGFSRMAVLTAGAQSDTIGRIAQRMIELETYRMMALLAFPVARGLRGDLKGLEDAMNALADAMTKAGDGGQDERLLDELSAMSARSEELASRTSFRFAASAAYYEIVRQRIDQLEGEPLEGVQQFGEFLERRLGPAMKTCFATSERLEALIHRLQRATNLLRTRVDLGLERQNAAMLASVDRRARLQLRLQQTVEGLSVVAIAYYAVGLIGYMAKALPLEEMGVSQAIIVGVATPLVLLAAWMLLKRVRRRLER